MYPEYNYLDIYYLMTFLGIHYMCKVIQIQFEQDVFVNYFNPCVNKV